MRGRVAALFLTLSLLASPAAVFGLTLGATADTHVEEKDEGANFGNSSTNRAGRAFDAEGANILRLLLQFDATQIPGSAQVEAATLRLFIDDTTTDPLGLAIAVQRLLTTFVEGDGASGVTWNSQPAAVPTPESTGVMNTAAGDWFEIGVKDVVVAALESGDTPGAIALRVGPVDEDTNEDREFEVRSKEFGDGSLRPQLVLELRFDDVPLLSVWAIVTLVIVLGAIGVLAAFPRAIVSK